MADCCPIKGCDTPLKADRLMCWWHWQMVHEDLRRRVWSAYRGVTIKRDKPNAIAEYRAASADAIAAVEARLQVREFITKQEPQP